MNDLGGIGKILLVLGGVIFILGLLLIFAEKIPFLGKLPGDFSWKGKNWSVYIPLATSILISVIVSLLLFLFRKFNG